MIGVADGDQNAACILCIRRVIVQRIRKLAEQDAGDLFLQEFLSSDLEILVNRQIDIIARLRIR